MPKGHTNNPKGRPKGSRNKKKRSIDREEYREVLHEVALDSLKELKDLGLKDRLNVLPKYMNYYLPRLHAVDGLKELEAERQLQAIKDEAMHESLEEVMTEEMKKQLQITYLRTLEGKLNRYGRKENGGRS